MARVRRCSKVTYTRYGKYQATHSIFGIVALSKRDAVMYKVSYKYVIWRNWLPSGTDNQDKMQQMQRICVTREH